MRNLATLAVTAVLLGACSLVGGGERTAQTIDTTVRRGDGPHPIAEVDPRDLPTPFTDRQLLDPGWEALPDEAEGIFLGIGPFTAHAVQFSATASDGTVLWTTQRPLSCTGFTLTFDGQRTLAVLTDLSPGTGARVAVTTASAYDLATGEQMWGPVEVPGPHAGPGLVFASLPEGGAMGASGPRMALDPASGALVATENTHRSERLIGEYHGVLLIAADEQLIGRDAVAGTEHWRLPLADLGFTDPDQVVAAPSSVTNATLAVIGDHASSALIDLVNGQALAHGVQDTALDASSGMHVTVERDHLRGRTRNGVVQWDQPIDAGARIVSVSGGVVYLREDGLIFARDAATGEPVQVYRTPSEAGAALPLHAAATGATVMQSSDRFLLATPQP